MTVERDGGRVLGSTRYLSLRPEHRGVQSLVGDLNRVYRDEPALWELDFDPSGFYWIEPNEAESNIVAFARTSNEL